MSLADRAAELLRAQAPRSATDLAERIGCRVGLLIAALDYDGRFRRVAGEGCWWWALDFVQPAKRRRRRNDQVEESADATAAVDARETVRPARRGAVPDAGMAPAADPEPVAVAVAAPPKPPLVSLPTTADRLALLLSDRRDAGLGGASVCFLAPALRIDRQHVLDALSADKRFRKLGSHGAIVWWGLAS